MKSKVAMRLGPGGRIDAAMRNLIVVEPTMGSTPPWAGVTPAPIVSNSLLQRGRRVRVEDRLRRDCLPRRGFGIRRCCPPPDAGSVGLPPRVGEARSGILRYSNFRSE